MKCFRIQKNSLKSLAQVLATICAFGMPTHRLFAQEAESAKKQGLEGIWVSADSYMGFQLSLSADNTKLEVNILHPQTQNNEIKLFVDASSERSKVIDALTTHDDKTPVWFSKKENQLMVSQRQVHTAKGAVINMVLRMVSDDHLTQEFQYADLERGNQQPQIENYFRAGSKAHSDAASRVKSANFSGSWSLTSAVEMSGDGKGPTKDILSISNAVKFIEVSMAPASSEINLPSSTQSVSIRSSVNGQSDLFSIPSKSRLLGAATRTRSLPYGFDTETVQAWVPAGAGSEKINKQSFANTTQFGALGVQRVVYLAIRRENDRLVITENDVEYAKEGSSRVVSRRVYYYEQAK
jgi:hypothetical protein